MTGNRESIAAKHATSAIPIVTIVSSDPIRIGLAASLARPGGNVTGLTTMDWGIYGYRTCLKPHCCSATEIAHTSEAPRPHEVETEARSLGVELFIAETDPASVEATIASAAANGAQAPVGAADGMVVARRREIAESAITHGLPTMFAFRENVEAGGLIMYAARVADLSRRAAFFVDSILKGARLPIEQPSAFELIINLTTAKILGLTLSSTLLAQVDEVIE